MNTLLKEKLQIAKVNKMVSEKTFKDIGEMIFKVFKESTDDMNADKIHYQKKMEMYKKLGEEMSDYIKELNEMDINMDSVEEKDPTKITTKQIEVINEFEKKIPSIIKTFKSLNIADKAKLKQNVKYLKSAQKDFNDKKIQIKISNPDTPTLKLSPMQKLKYRKRKNL